jgi:hypothetical protein
MNEAQLLELTEPEEVLAYMLRWKQQIKGCERDPNVMMTHTWATHCKRLRTNQGMFVSPVISSTMSVDANATNDEIEKLPRDHDNSKDLDFSKVLNSMPANLNSTIQILRSVYRKQFEADMIVAAKTSSTNDSTVVDYSNVIDRAKIDFDHKISEKILRGTDISPFVLLNS